MSRLEEIAERWEERPGVLAEVTERGQGWKRVYPAAAFPENLSLAVATASDLTAAHNDLVALLAFAREVDRVAEYLRTTEDKTVQTHAWLALAAAIERLEDDRG